MVGYIWEGEFHGPIDLSWVFAIQYKKQLNQKLFKTKQQLKQTICFTQIYLKLNRCNLECKILRVLNILRNLADTLFETNKNFPKAKPDLALPNKLDILLDIPETLSNSTG